MLTFGFERLIKIISMFSNLDYQGPIDVVLNRALSL